MNLSTFDIMSPLYAILGVPTPKGLIQMGTITPEKVALYFAIMLAVILICGRIDAAKAKKGQSK